MEGRGITTNKAGRERERGRRGEDKDEGRRKKDSKKRSSFHITRVSLSYQGRFHYSKDAALHSLPLPLLHSSLLL